MKYFVISDIHSYCRPMRLSLSMAGFEEDSPEHALIVVGDVFDRGPDTLKVYECLSGLSNVILLRGNHEDLYVDLLNKGFPDHYDIGNGTVDTFLQIAGEDIDGDEFELMDFDSRVELWMKAKEKVSESPITSWVKSKAWKDYLEIGNYIIAHSFIPLHNRSKLPMYSQFGNYRPEYFGSWRKTATEKEWREARWGCPWMLYKDGYFEKEEEKGKTLICGHWKTDDFHKELSGKDNDFEIYYSPGLIGVDGCVRLTGRQNVLVIDGDNLYDRYGGDLRHIEEEEASGYFESVDGAWDMRDRSWCGADCGKKACVRNVRYNDVAERCATFADFRSVCDLFEPDKVEPDKK